MNREIERLIRLIRMVEADAARLRLKAVELRIMPLKV